MLRLSIVIPASQDQNALETTLLSVLENRPTQCEVLVVCNLDYRDEYDLDDEVRFIRIPNRRAEYWHEMANVGVSESAGDVIHVLQPGITVEEGWTDAAIELLDYEPEVAAVSPLVFTSDATAPLIGVVVGPGARRLDVWQGGTISQDTPAFAPSEIAGFYRRSSLCCVGGWDNRIAPDLANVELGCAIAMRGQRCRVARLSQVHLLHPKHSADPSVFALATSQELLVRRYNGITDQPLGSSALLSAFNHMPNSVPYLLGRMAGRFSSARRARTLDQSSTTTNTSSRAA